MGTKKQKGERIMPSGINAVILGHLGKEPQLRYTQNGVPVCSFSLAVSRRRGDDEVTTWFNVSCWRQAAEFIARHATKGTLVQVVADSIELREWQGERGSGVSLDVNATQVWVLSGGVEQREPAVDNGNVGDVPF
jgi:single-strand DNA-binding protein